MSGQPSGNRNRRRERIIALLYLAEQDTEAARLLAASDNHYAAYHCQQATEKLIRAVLLHHGVEPGLDHHLDVMVAKIPDDDPWRAKLAPLVRYTVYATTFRYETPGGRVPVAPDPGGVADDAAHIAVLIAEARQVLAGT